MKMHVSMSHHHVRNTCPNCHGVTTCRCSAPKVETQDLCQKCKREGVSVSALFDMSTSALFTEQEVRARAERDNVTVDVKLTGSQACIDRIMSLLGMIQFNGNVGHSGVFGVAWDGDGADRIKVEGPIPDHRKTWDALCSYGGSVEIVNERGQGTVVTSTGKFKRIYPEEKD